MSAVKTKRFSIEEYHQLSDLGFFAPEERVELIRGEIVAMAAKGTPHSVCNTRLFRQLTLQLGDNAIVRSQEPIVLFPNSEPEPDLSVVRYREDEYLSAHPQPDDVLLVVEIADSTLKVDRDLKLSLYAEYGIANYWIFNLVDRRLETYSEPLPKAKTYRSRRVFFPSETVKLPCFPNVDVDLNLIFP